MYLPGVSIVGYCRYTTGDPAASPENWPGDACGCLDDRCKDGYHHDPHEECGCFGVYLTEYLCSLHGHRWDVERVQDWGGGPFRYRRCTSCTAVEYLTVPAASADATAG